MRNAEHNSERSVIVQHQNSYDNPKFALTTVVLEKSLYLLEQWNFCILPNLKIPRKIHYEVKYNPHGVGKIKLKYFFL